MSVKERKTILIILVLNILLPTLDIVTDINLVIKLYRGAQYCDPSPRQYDDYEKCLEDPLGYCSNDENNQKICLFVSHPAMATAMLAPFLLNYIVCFISFFLNKEKNKKFTFIFALLNLYPQFGKNNRKEENLK